MVFPVSDSSNENTKPRNLLILQKLKQARAEHQNHLQKDEISPKEIAPNVSKKFVHKKSLKLELLDSSSSSSSNMQTIDKLRLIKRSTVQEKLFAAQCEQSRQNFAKYRRPLTESGSSSNTVNRMHQSRLQGNCKRKLKMYNGYNDDAGNKGNNANCNGDEGNVNDEYETGVLHLRKPLQLVESDELNYFNGRGRNEPIDWSLINGEKNEINKKSNYVKIDQNISSPEKIQQISDGLPIGDTEFINFVNNSTTHDTVYRVYNNLKNTIKNASESPILKIQKAINQCKTDAITITQEIRESFAPSLQEQKIINLIDVIIKKSPSFQNKQPHQTSRSYNYRNNVNSAMQKIQKENIEKFKKSQIKEVKAESINISNNCNHITKRNGKIDNYNDDMIGFVKPNTQLVSSSLISSEKMDKEFDIDENSDPAYINRKLLDKLKSSRMSRIHSSLDSDDVSTERSSELDDLSATRRSTISKYESLKKRLLTVSTSVSTQTSPKKRSIDKANRNLLLRHIQKAKMEESEEEPLIKESSTRYLGKPNIIIDNTVVETETDIPKEKPLLKPVSTRYFSTLPKEEKITNESKNELLNEENIIKITTNESISNELSISNKKSAKETNDEIEEIISGTKEIKEIKYKANCFNESKHEEIIEENVIKTTDNESISNEECRTKENNDEIEEIVSGPKETEEIYEDNYSTSLSKESILTTTDKKIKNNLNSDSTTNSSYDTKDSEKSSTLSSFSDIQNQSPLPICKEQQLADYEDINSDEEFDVVNCDQFSAFASLVSKLQQVAAAQKEHALSLANEFKNDDSDVINEVCDNDSLDLTNELNNNDMYKNVSQNHLKAIESSLDVSDNNFSSISASVSSNLESDNENSINSSSSSNLLLTNKNIFENVEIKVEQLNNYHFNNDETSSAAEVNNQIEQENRKTVMSTRQKKIANALKNYQKSKGTKGGNEALQKNSDAEKNESLSNKESNKRNQILEEIKKRKLHLNCKPWIANSLN